MCDNCMKFSQRDAEFFFDTLADPPPKNEAFIEAQKRYAETKMNNIDNNRKQYQLLGNSVRLTPEPQILPQNEKTLLRTLVSEMSRSGNFEEAMRLLCDTIEEMEKRIKELEEK